MASVISAQLISSRLQRSGRRSVRYRFVLADNAAAETVVRVGPKSVPAGFDTDADMITVGEALLKSRAIDERLDRKRVHPTDDPLSYVLDAKWAAPRRMARTLIRWMMKEQDPLIVIFLEPLIVYLKANYTAAQLRNFLDLTPAQLTRMNRRINAVLSDSGTVKDQLVLFEADVEEISDD